MNNSFCQGIHRDMDVLNIQPKVDNELKAYTIVEAALRLRRSEKSVRRMIQRGKLRRDKNSYKILIPARDVDTYFERNSSFAD
jgi:excisionase family DNA binding protein